MKVTIQDIANMVGVSKSTVSRYLNGGYVSKANSEKIEEAINKTGFKSNFFATRLKTKNSGLIGIVIPRIDSYTTGKILKSINKELDDRGYQGIILSSELIKDKEISNIKKLYQQGVDGIIVMTSGITKEHVNLVKKFTIPVIFTGQSSSLVNYIKIDDTEVGRTLGEYIKEMGHKDIVYLGVSNEDKAVGVERREGFFSAFDESDCNVNFVQTDFNFQTSYEKGEEVMKYNPTAVIGATDNIILGFMKYAFEKGYSIPGDISVAGIGGYNVSMAIHPSVTTVEIDYETLGKKATNLIISSIEEKETNEDKSIPIKLIKRESVKKKS